MDCCGDTTVQLCHAGEFINTLEHLPTVVKMDIEGQEYGALAAMADYLRKEKPFNGNQYLSCAGRFVAHTIVHT